jgi:hypothetical protein
MQKVKLYSLKEIADLYGRPYSTTRNHIIKLTKQRLFRKESLGVNYTQEEFDDLKRLLKLSVAETAPRFVKLPWASKPK